MTNSQGIAATFVAVALFSNLNLRRRVEVYFPSPFFFLFFFFEENGKNVELTFLIRYLLTTRSF